MKVASLLRLINDSRLGEYRHLMYKDHIMQTVAFLRDPQFLRIPFRAGIQESDGLLTAAVLSCKDPK